MKYAIFDLDGTLTDSMGMWRNITAAYLKEKGIDPPQQLKLLQNNTWVQEFIKLAKNNYSLAIEPQEFRQWIANYAIDQYTNIIPLKKGVIQLLNKLQKQNVQMCICSSAPFILMEPALKRLDILKYFKFTCHCEEFGSEKDKPQIYLYCMQKLGAENQSQVVVFEDALYAAETAKKAGFYVVGIYDATELNQDKLKITADQYITCFDNLNFNTLPN